MMVHSLASIMQVHTTYPVRKLPEVLNFSFELFCSFVSMGQDAVWKDTFSICAGRCAGFNCPEVSHMK